MTDSVTGVSEVTERRKNQNTTNNYYFSCEQTNEF